MHQHTQALTSIETSIETCHFMQQGHSGTVALHICTVPARVLHASACAHSLLVQRQSETLRDAIRNSEHAHRFDGAHQRQEYRNYLYGSIVYMFNAQLVPCVVKAVYPHIRLRIRALARTPICAGFNIWL